MVEPGSGVLFSEQFAGLLAGFSNEKTALWQKMANLNLKFEKSKKIVVGMDIYGGRGCGERCQLEFSTLITLELLRFKSVGKEVGFNTNPIIAGMSKTVLEN